MGGLVVGNIFFLGFLSCSGGGEGWEQNYGNRFNGEAEFYPRPAVLFALKKI